MDHKLTTEEMRHYQERGYVIPKYRVPDALLGRLRSGIDHILATYTDVAQEDLANPHMMPPLEGPQVNPFL